ncbi:PRC-barrel domain-containing protein [Microbaculum marinum]|uniref:PRC-barrel domain-containing protein n=1 Tax=Microbaculum marinum TaxID=1764581 RepID=A0AAW9RW71_9HYPH
MKLHINPNRFLATSAIVLALAAPAYAQTQTDANETPPAAVEQSGEQSTGAATGAQTGQDNTGTMTGTDTSDAAGDMKSTDQTASDTNMDSDAPELKNTMTDKPAGADTADASNMMDDGLPTEPILAEQQPGQLVSDEIIGTDVRNAQDESIGTIDALVIDDNNRVIAAVVSVGGFLGLGAKDVAVNWKEFTFQPEEEIAVVSLSREQLEDGPVFRDRDDVQAELEADQQRQEMNTQPNAATPAAPAAPADTTNQ